MRYTRLTALVVGGVAGVDAKILPRAGNVTTTSTIYASTLTVDVTSIVYASTSTLDLTSTSTVIAKANATSSDAGPRLAGGGVVSLISSTTSATVPTSIPTSGTGLEYASSCDAIKQAWETEPSVAIGTTTITSYHTWNPLNYSTSYDTFTNYNNNSSRSIYTLCDGWPRVDATLSVSKTVITSKSTTSSLATETSTLYSNISAPMCTIMPDDCSVLSNSWSSVDSIWTAYQESYREWLSTAPDGASNTWQTPTVTALQQWPPVCGSATIRPLVTSVGPPACAFQDAEVKLLYWPVERPSGELCGNATASPVTAAPSIEGRPNIFVTNNSTLTSPTVYIQIQGQWAYSENGEEITATSDWFLPQSPESVSSYCATTGGDFGEARAVDYADFNYPIPASAYRCQPHCWTSSYKPSYVDYTWSGLGTGQIVTFSSLATENLCSTIWDDYAPALSIPQDFYSMSGITLAGGGTFGSQKCQFLAGPSNVFWDPPKALSAQSKIAGVTRPSEASSAKATPVSSLRSQAAETGSLPGPTTPRQTSVPNATPTTESRSTKVSAQSDALRTSSEDEDPTRSTRIATVEESQTSLIIATPATSAEKEATKPTDPAPTPSTTSRNIGDIIASAIGEIKPSSSGSGEASTDTAVPVDASPTGVEADPASTGDGSSAAEQTAQPSAQPDTADDNDNDSDNTPAGQQTPAPVRPMTDDSGNDDDLNAMAPSETATAPTDPGELIVSVINGQASSGVAGAQPNAVVEPDEAIPSPSADSQSTTSVQPDGSTPPTDQETQATDQSAATLTEATEADTLPMVVVQSSTDVAQPAITGVVLTASDDAVLTIAPSGVEVDAAQGEATPAAAVEQTTFVSGVGTVVLQPSNAVIAGSTKAYSTFQVVQASVDEAQPAVTGVVITASDSSVFTVTPTGVAVDAAQGEATDAAAVDQTTIVPGVGTVVLQSNGVVVAGSTQAYSTIHAAAASPEVTGSVTVVGVITDSAGEEHTLRYSALDSAADFTTSVDGLGTVVVQYSGVVVSGSTQYYHSFDSGTQAAGGVITDSEGTPYTISYNAALPLESLKTTIDGLGTVVIQSTGVVVQGSTQAFQSVTASSAAGSTSETSDMNTASDVVTASASASVQPASAGFALRIRLWSTGAALVVTALVAMLAM